MVGRACRPATPEREPGTTNRRIRAGQPADEVKTLRVAGDCWHESGSLVDSNTTLHLAVDPAFGDVDAAVYFSTGTFVTGVDLGHRGRRIGERRGKPRQAPSSTLNVLRTWRVPSPSPAGARRAPSSAAPPPADSRSRDRTPDTPAPPRPAGSRRAPRPARRCRRASGS